MCVHTLGNNLDLFTAFIHKSMARMYLLHAVLIYKYEYTKMRTVIKSFKV